MYYKEYGKITANVYHNLKMPHQYVTNIALEMCLQNLYRDMRLVSEYMGTSITFDLNYRYPLFTAQDIVDCFVYNGFKVVLTVNSELKNKVRLTVMWTNELFNNTIQR